MHLVYRALDGEQVPSTIAPGLIPPSKRQIVVSTTMDSSSIASENYSPRSPSSSPAVVGFFSILASGIRLFLVISMRLGFVCDYVPFIVA